VLQKYSLVVSFTQGHVKKIQAESSSTQPRWALNLRQDEICVQVFLLQPCLTFPVKKTEAPGWEGAAGLGLDLQ